MFRPVTARFRLLPLLTALLAVTPACCFAVARAGTVKAPPVPAVSLPLERYGYRPLGNNIALRAGFAGATVHYVDADHLLLTYSARKLMKRSPDQREGDDDHTVRAEVIHLPDGKVVRETEWRMHDRAPYLWPLGNGRFLLRERGDLYSLNPMGNDAPEVLGRRRLIESDQDLVALELSPGGDLMMLETVPPRRVGDDPDEKRDVEVATTFYAIGTDEHGAVHLANRGRAVARSAFSLALTPSGVLQTVQEDRTHWGFDFRAFDGKKLELAGFTSTCRPRSYFVSDAEFFAYGCRGGEDRRLMAGFNLLGDAKWVFTIDDAPLWLAVDAAPQVGRFAVRSTVTTVSAQESDRLGADDIRAQEVRVYSDRDGDELLRVLCSPAQRPAGNFSLSPDGLQLAILHGSDLEVYQLPPVSAADRALHQKEQAMLTNLRSSTSVNIAKSLSETPDEH